MMVLASLAATFYVYYRAPSKGLSKVVALDLGILGTLAGIVGTRLFHVFVEAPGYYWQHPSHIYQIWRGGLVSHGGIILITVTFLIYFRMKKLPMWKYLDLCAPAFAIINFFIRLGCLSAGCCYGKPTHFFIHLVFKSPASDAGYKFQGVPLHATQVYDLLLSGVFLFFILNWIDRKKKFDGQVTACFFILYGFMRGMVEFLRGDLDRGVYAGGMISTGQIMGLCSIVFGFILYFYRRRVSLLT